MRGPCGLRSELREQQAASMEHQEVRILVGLARTARAQHPTAHRRCYLRVPMERVVHQYRHRIRKWIRGDHAVAPKSAVCGQVELTILDGLLDGGWEALLLGRRSPTDCGMYLRLAAGILIRVGGERRYRHQALDEYSIGESDGHWTSLLHWQMKTKTRTLLLFLSESLETLHRVVQWRLASIIKWRHTLINCRICNKNRTNRNKNAN
jgi:hypothetical protein